MPQFNSTSDTPKLPLLPKTAKAAHHKHNPHNYNFWTRPTSHRTIVFQSNLKNKILATIIISLAIIGAFTVAKFAYYKLSAKYGDLSVQDIERRLVVNPQSYTPPSSSQSSSSRCTNICTETFCKDGKILVECKDTNGDGCTEFSETTCGFSCENKLCSDVQDTFTLQTGDSIVQFAPTQIRLMTINADKTITLDVGGDIYIMAQGDAQTAKGLSITVNTIGTSTATLKVKKV